MSWSDDHRNAVADRWGRKYRESGMTLAAFTEYMRKTMLEYGWSKPDTERMIARATGKENEQ